MKDSRKRGGLVAVARAAGVSPATVSRAFNLPELVNEEVRARILSIAAEQQYRPDPAARALRSRRTHMVGVALPTLAYSIFSRLINSFQERLAKDGYTTIILSTGFDNRNIHAAVQLLLDRGAEAVLLVGAVEDPRVAALIRQSRAPFVTTYVYPSDGTVPAVGFDNGAAMEKAVDHLLSLGHRSFGMIAGLTEGNDRQRDRIAAFRRCIRRAGARGEDAIVCRPFDMASGASALSDLLDRHPGMTALVCSSDVFAVGAMAECRRRGLVVPDDLSIVGFDDAEYASLLCPPLTTITVPAEEMGERAAEAILTSLRKKVPIRPLQLDSVLTVRSTTAAPGKRTRTPTAPE